MTLQLIIYNIICVSFFLLALISFANPTKLNATANRWFAVFLFSAGCMVLNAIIYKAGVEVQYANLIVFNELFRFIIAPALYLCILHFTSPEKVLKPKEYLHFVPAALFFVMMAFNISAIPLFRIPEILSNTLAITISAFAKAQLLIYWILSWIALSRHQKNIRLINSSTNEIDLNWLKYLLLGIIFMIATLLIAPAVQRPTLEKVIPALYLAATLFMGYFLLAQKEVYAFDEPELKEIAEVIKPETKHPKRLTDEQIAQLKTKLEHLMQTEKVYLDNELSLLQLAKEMGGSTHDLSYLLNEGFGTNFFRFVNAYRVKEAKQLMLSDKHRHLNLLGISYSAGFNSKTTFNTAFKRETGMSPTEFIREKEAVPIHLSV